MRCGFADMLLGSPRFLGSLVFCCWLLLVLVLLLLLALSCAQLDNPAHQSDSDSVRLRL